MSKNASLPAATANAVPQSFRDTAFKSRQLFLADGRAVVVEDYMVTTSDKDVIEFLGRHPDFEHQSAGREAE